MRTFQFMSFLSVSALIVGCGLSSTPTKSLTGTATDAVAAAQREALGLGDISTFDASAMPPLTAPTFSGSLIGQVSTPTQNFITSIPNLVSVGTITSGTWSGSFGAVSGANLTSLNASNLSSGTVADARLPAASNTITSLPNLATVGTITSGIWNGTLGAVSGTSLTSLDASNLSIGTVPDARLPATSTTITSLPNLATVGTITSGTWNGTLGAVSGTSLTSLDASKLLIGTVPDARLPASSTQITSLSNLATVGTITSGTWQGTPLSDTYLNTIATAGKVLNSATTATATNTPNMIVARDSAGGFNAGVIAATSLKLTASSSAPATCNSSNDGMIGLHSTYVLCVCKNGTGWIRTDTGVACTSW